MRDQTIFIGITTLSLLSGLLVAAVAGVVPKVGGSQTRKEAVYPTVPDDFLWEIPIISESCLPDAPLGRTNQFWIYTKAMSVAPSTSRLWFVLNIPRMAPDKHDWEVNCYFMPTNISGRLCGGSFVHLDSRDHGPEKGNYWEVGLVDYSHVLPPDQGFTTNAPPTSLLPFMVAGNLDEHTIVQIADIVRKLAQGSILSMRLKEDGRIEVSTATSRAFLAGRGMIYVLEKKDDAWVVVKTLHWVS
jgi:hypothetical protein